jgi:nicotinamidase-related amidase
MYINKQSTLNAITATMEQFIDSLEHLETLSINDFSSDETLVVMIDMINGFCKFGPLHSPFVNAMVPSMSTFLDATIKKNIPILSYRDSHPADAFEFRSYPPHCVAGSEESELVTELLRPELIDVPKNSTNGFLAQNPFALVPDLTIQHLFVIGCVTDICVRDFTATMNKYCEEINHHCQVYIIENLVDTFHIEGIHDRESEHVLALYQLRNSGVKLVRI